MFFPNNTVFRLYLTLIKIRALIPVYYGFFQSVCVVFLVWFLCVFFFISWDFCSSADFAFFLYISHTFATAYATTNEFVRQILYYAIFQFNFYMVMDNTCLFEFGNALISSNLQYLYSVFFLFVCHNFTSYVVFHLVPSLCKCLCRSSFGFFFLLLLSRSGFNFTLTQ